MHVEKVFTFATLVSTVKTEFGMDGNQRAKGWRGKTPHMLFQ